MSFAASQLDAFEREFFGGDRQEAMGLLAKLVDDGIGFGPSAALGEIVRRIDHPHPGFAAYLALAGGAFVENGQPPGPLGRALVAPLRRALVDARRMLDHVAHLDDAELEEPDEDEEEEEHHGHANGHGNAHAHAHDDDGEPHLLIGRKAVDRAFLDDLATRDVAAIQAWFSLDVWYRPAVATWTRDTSVLREVQSDTALRRAIAELGSETETSHWLSLLIETVFDAPFVVLFPELDEAYSLTVSGVVDMGQLCALITPPLREPLARIGVEDAPDREVLAVMRGEGPQQGDGTYACSFHCYPVEATDPQTGFPRDDVHEWRAPGGTGTHSLPPDFLPGTLTAIEGTRVLLLVGPKSEGMRFVRSMPAVRTFDGLEARVSAASRLGADDARRWFALAKSRAV